MKPLTRAQLEGRKEKAVRFTRDVLGDPDRAEEIEAESLEDYAERRKVTLLNSSKRRTALMPKSTKTKADLEDQIAELQDQNEELQDQLAAIADIVSPGDDDDQDDDEPAMMTTTETTTRTDPSPDVWAVAQGSRGGNRPCPPVSCQPLPATGRSNLCILRECPLR